MTVGELVKGVQRGDEAAARALKQVARVDAGALDEFRGALLRTAHEMEDLRVRWNLVEVIGRMRWKGAQRGAAVDWLFFRLRDESPLTRTCALQALWDLSVEDPELPLRAVGVAERFLEDGTAAMRARARRLLKGL